MHQRYFLASFAQHPGLGAGRLGRLGALVKGDWEKLWTENCPNITPQEATFLTDVRKKIDPQKIELFCKKEGVSVLTADDKDLPPLLKEIPLPPVVLFMKGNIDVLLQKNLISIVGTRRMSAYGKLVVGKIVPDLVGAGFTTVSGLALGVDAQVHRQTIAAKGKTVAFLPSGISLVYPAQHQSLARDILKGGGALVSEFPFGAKAQKHHFLIRNRLIAGLTRATVVIEATEHSGTQLTAQAALDSNREVFAVPGSIFSSFSKGTHRLIKAGAHLLEEVSDIYQELGIEQERLVKHYEPLVEEQALLAAIPLDRPVGRDHLFALLKQEGTQINAQLTMLELKRVIVALPGNQVQRIVEIA